MTDSHSPTTPRPVPIGEPPTTGRQIRLARLRPEHASRYEGLDAGAWYPAASLAAYYQSWLIRHPDRTGDRRPLRGLETSHFEFRGGVPRDPPWLPGRSAEERTGNRDGDA
jgi:hypothetical protein